MDACLSAGRPSSLPSGNISSSCSALGCRSMSATKCQQFNVAYCSSVLSTDYNIYYVVGVSYPVCTYIIHCTCICTLYI